jgi:hypothetical protein
MDSNERFNIKFLESVETIEAGRMYLVRDNFDREFYAVFYDEEAIKKINKQLKENDSK